MRLTRLHRAPALVLPLLAFAVCAGGAPQVREAEGVPIRITVTAAAKEAGREVPGLAKEDFLVYQDRGRRRVLDAVRLSGERNKIDLYIFVDDATRSNVTLDFGEISNFVRELPAAARVGVLYARNGTFLVAQELTTDREAALKTLRKPLGSVAGSGGIYLSLAELGKRLPPSADRRRAVVFLGSGIDVLRGRGETNPGVNPDLDLAINHLTASEVVVYPIYVSPAPEILSNLALVANGQSCLKKLATETGGEAFWEGFGTPVTMKPFLDDVSRDLNNQYWVTFAAKPAKKPDYAEIRVKTELSGVRVIGPTRVFVPAGK